MLENIDKQYWLGVVSKEINLIYSFVCHIGTPTGKALFYTCDCRYDKAA